MLSCCKYLVKVPFIQLTYNMQTQNVQNIGDTASGRYTVFHLGHFFITMGWARNFIAVGTLANEKVRKNIEGEYIHFVPIKRHLLQKI